MPIDFIICVYIENRYEYTYIIHIINAPHFFETFLRSYENGTLRNFLYQRKKIITLSEKRTYIYRVGSDSQFRWTTTVSTIYCMYSYTQDY